MPKSTGQKASRKRNDPIFISVKSRNRKRVPPRTPADAVSQGAVAITSDDTFLPLTHTNASEGIADLELRGSIPHPDRSDDPFGNDPPGGELVAVVVPDDPVELVIPHCLILWAVFWRLVNAL